jgi:uncharacterized protein YyaL (SSP411 family)
MSLSPDCADRLRWLKTSGIQIGEGPDAGAVCAWLDEETGDKSFLYSEITGYFITLACHLAQLDDRRYWTSRAEEAGNWIVRVAMQENGAILTRKYNSSNADPFCFSKKLSVYFDCCMVGYGLINLYELTGEEKWLDSAIRIAEFCLSKFISVKARVQHPVYDLQNGKYIAQTDHWSQHWGSFELKSCLFFSALHTHANNDKYDEVVEYLIPMALSAQKSNGRFATNKSHTSTHLHPHNYTIEALLYLYSVRGETELLERAQAAMEFTFSHCLNPSHDMTHSWPDHDSYCGVSLRSDVLAQSLRCYYIGKILATGYCRDWEKHIPRLHEIMDSFTLESGGTSYGINKQNLLSPHANAWCYMFCLEMYMFRDYHAGRAEMGKLMIT